MIKTKYLFAKTENYGMPDAVHHSLDTVINKFLESEHITPEKLIDIKLSPVGYFQSNGGEGEIESSALVIYKIN